METMEGKQMLVCPHCGGPIYGKLEVAEGTVFGNKNPYDVPWRIQLLKSDEFLVEEYERTAAKLREKGDDALTTAWREYEQAMFEALQECQALGAKAQRRYARKVKRASRKFRKDIKRIEFEEDYD